MEKYGLIGWPVSHSLSPQIHNPAFKDAGIDAHYETVECPPEKIATIVDSLKQQGFKGWNCTVPHKADIIPFLSYIDPEAAACQSVNTVIVQGNGELHGYSTDGYGIETAIKEELDISVQGKNIIFLGAGGAARAAAARLAKSGAKSIKVINRSEANGLLLVDSVKDMNPKCETQYIASSQVDKSLFADTDLLIQCTSLGLKADDPLPLDTSFLPPGLKIYDMIYKSTPFQKGAQQQGCQVAAGLGMLLHQGVKSWEM